MQDKAQAAEAQTATLRRRGGPNESARIKGKYVVKCFDSAGNLKWSDTIDNVVTTVGKNEMLDTHLAGSAYTASVVMGLKGTGTAVAADTMASHASWLEVGGVNAPAYTGNRPAPTFSAAAGGAKATSADVSFTFTSGGTVAGCFITQGGSATKDNTTGTLVSAGDFSGGNRTVVATDVLDVSYTLTLT